MKIIKLLILLCLITFNVFAQDTLKKDKAIFKENKNGYYQNTILRSIKDYNDKDNVKKPYKYFSVDFTGFDLPVSDEQFTKYWYNKPLSQGSAGTCWCFSATSFLESEIYRLTKQKVKLSEMYFVYWEYVERVRRFVKERGNSYFSQGSESNGVIRMMKFYGAVPDSVYHGTKKGQKFYDHSKMFEQMNSYLKSVKNDNNWNEKQVIKTTKSILNFYMGTPPSKFLIKGKEVTPKDYVKNILKLNPNNYFSFMSTKEQPYNQKGELKEDDNWWHCDSYYNVSLDDYIKIIIKAITNGYTISICGDVSESGYDSSAEVGIIPDFDIPSDYINEDSRQFRLSNKTTTDDHCIHLVGYIKKNNKYWFLIKDSGSGGFDGNNKGYRFLNEDYVRLKMMNILVHKDAGEEILDKIIK